MRDNSSLRELRADLMSMALGYWRSQVLFASERLGVFKALTCGPLTAAEVARAISADPAMLERLLLAAAHQGLLVRHDGKFSNGPMASQLLVQGDASMVDWLAFIGDSYDAWGRLGEAVETGRPVASREQQFGQDKESTRNLILAMRDYARGPGRAMPLNLDLQGRRRLLDVGGGPGTYSTMLAERYPELEAVIFDLPPVAAIARELIQEQGLQDRVTTVAGDYLVDDLPTGFDVVLLSNMLHQEDPAECQALLKRAADSLVPGGLLVVQLAFLDQDRSGPPWALLQALQVGLFFEGGRTYTQEEILDMLAPSGFVNGRTQRTSLISPESLILADKPMVS